MTTGRVIVVGSINLDLLYRVPHLPRPGETLLGAELVRLSGGKGGNQAHAAAKVAPAEVSVAMVGCVGDDDAATMLRGDLAAAGVDVSAVRSVAGPSGTALIAVDERGENTIVVIPGANATWPSAAATSIDLRPGDVVVLQLEVPFAVVEATVAGATAAGARVALNAAPLDRRVLPLLEHVDALIVNEIEARELFGFDVALGADDVAGTAADLDTALVVTLGARGVLFAPARGAAMTLPAFAVDAIDTVGAGDAFIGGFAAAWAAGGSLETAVRWGAAAGALTATVSGARHPDLTPAAVQALAGSLG
ncbi:MAG: ribokinase [Pseudolysinimonas sp.]|uniref:ribokinase n=1 Tax=Pseudolysinimonas sp. TaxID=2680009 RepID=UPI003C70DF03